MPVNISGVNDDEKLSIESVLNGTADESDLNVLYASKIDVTEAEKKIDDFISDIKSSVNDATEKIDDIERILALTNSKRFYLGSTAKKNIDNMSQARGNLENLVKKSNAIDKEEILKVINNYNEQLAILKKKCRLKCLQAKADEYNNEHHVESTNEKTCSATRIPPYEGDRYDLKGNVTSNIKYLETPCREFGSQALSKDLKYVETVYDIIEYWRFLPGDDWFSSLLDENVEELEKEFKDRGLELPYDKGKLIDC